MDQELPETFAPNSSALTYFILVGFSDLPKLHYTLLTSFYFMYIITIAGNSFIINLVIHNNTLQSPMYFFICNLAFLDICYTSVTLPNLIRLHSGREKNISYAGCISQQYFYISFAVSEYFLLAAMAYDRYVAICNPLHYSRVMNHTFCNLLAQGCWLTGFLSSMVPVSFSARFQFCGSHIINHFFCDLTALIKLVCSKISDVQIVIFIESVTLGLIPFLFTITSYVSIVRTILKVHAKGRRGKTFSTCASHLTVVILFYGTMIGVYMRPASMYSPAHDKLYALLYTAVIPMLNPIIYTLRNRDVQEVMKNILNIHFHLKNRYV